MTRGSFNGVSSDDGDGRWICDSPLCTVSSRIWQVLRRPVETTSDNGHWDNGRDQTTAFQPNARDTRIKAWRPRWKSACQSLSDYFAEAACSAGLPKTLRQPSLRLARCLRMQAVMRCTFGISDAQSRRTSPVQSRRLLACVNS